MPSKSFLYHLDETAAHCIRGWVKHSRLTRPVEVKVYFEGKLVGATTAAEFRQDLVDAGIGHGHYGFEITPNINRASLDPIRVEIFFGKQHIETCEVTPDHDATLRGFARVIEDRMDALLALTRERMQRELDQKLREHQQQADSASNTE